MHTKETEASAGSRDVWLRAYFKLFAYLNRTNLIQKGADLVYPSGCQWLMKNSEILSRILFCYRLAFGNSPEIACQSSVACYW